MKERVEDKRYVVLCRLADIAKPVSILEIGFTATAQVIRNMAARGLVRVTVEMTDRGVETMEKEKAKRKRRDVNNAKEARRAVGGF